jgi:hypothetical protein
MKPYTYLIKHRPSGKVYYGFRCANKVEPHNDLWKHYFTSSPRVQQLIEETGTESFDVEIRRIFESKEQAVAWETRVLTRCKVLHDDRWLNQNVAGYIVPTDQSRKKISDFHKDKPKSDEHRQKMRNAQKGKPKKSKVYQTPAYRELMSKIKSGEGNARYGVEVSEETRQRISKAKKGKQVAHNKGVPMSDEQKSILRETKERNKVMLTCEVCNKIMRASHFKIYSHGPNCRSAK